MSRKRKKTKRKKTNWKPGEARVLYCSKQSLSNGPTREKSTVIGLAITLEPGEQVPTSTELELLHPGMGSRDNWISIPWTDFLGGVLSGSAARQMDVTYFIGGENVAIPLTEKGITAAVQRTGDRRWLEKTWLEIRRESVRTILSVKFGVEFPDLDTIEAMMNYNGPYNPEISVLPDEAEVQRAANFGQNTWIARPDSGRFLVKLQRPLTPGKRAVDQSPWLIYNEDRSLHGFIGNPAMLIAAGMALQGRIKGFVYATVDGSTVAIETALQPDPGW